jgi:two-component system, NarL family, sensor histidine kinase BarA
MLHGPVELARVVPAGELEELVDSIRRALGAELAIFAPRGERLAGSEAAGAACQDVMHDGELLARLGASGQGAERALQLAHDMLGLLVHHASAREMASSMHEEAMRLTFAELTEHNTRLQKAVARLEELDRLKSNFLATMSHELRTPLTSVIGYTEMMAEGLAGPITGEQREYLTTILSKADQLLGMITSVLDVASIETAPLPVERCRMSLADIVASEVATYAALADKRGITIQIETRGDASILGDKKKIRQVVAHLISNAVKFTPDEGRVTITLRAGALSPADPDVRAVQLVVSDSGIGISRDQVSKIFEPFFQVDSSSTRAFGGTGLGLTLAKAYVEAHGGRIWVDTTPGQGSTFVATFPAPPAIEVGDVPEAEGAEAT